MTLTKLPIFFAIVHTSQSQDDGWPLLKPKNETFAAINTKIDDYIQFWITPSISPSAVESPAKNDNHQQAIQLLLVFTGITVLTAILIMLHTMGRIWPIDHTLGQRRPEHNNIEFLKYLNIASKAKLTSGAMSADLEQSNEYLYRRWLNGESTGNKLISCFGHDFTSADKKETLDDYAKKQNIRLNQITVTGTEVNCDDI